MSTEPKKQLSADEKAFVEAATKMADPLNQTPLINLAWQPDVPDELLIALMESLLKAGAKVNRQGWIGGTGAGAVLDNVNYSLFAYLRCLL